jgi:lysophospholipase L1-like esterase
LAGALGFFLFRSNEEEKAQEEYYASLNEQMREEERAVEEEIEAAYEKLESDFFTYLPGIVCWGDSLTAGAGGDGTTYPNVLESLIKENLVDRFDAEQLANSLGQSHITGLNQYSLDSVPVINMGVGGETTNTILGRNGAVPFVVAEDFTIPASNTSDTTAVEIHFVSENGKNVAPLRQGESGVNPVVIDGIEGVISIQQESYISEDYTYYFTRSAEESGDADKDGGAGESNDGNTEKDVTVKAGTEIITSGSTQYLDYIPVIFIGQNGGYDDINDLIAQQRAMIDHQEMSEANQGKFIIVGLHTGTAADRAELEKAMQEEYGDQYINLREYMSTSGLQDAGIEATDEDKEMMAEGMTPQSLLASDKLHFNEYGYELIGSLIYDRMDELGYFDEIKADLEELG